MSAPVSAVALVLVSAVVLGSPKAMRRAIPARPVGYACPNAPCSERRVRFAVM